MIQRWLSLADAVIGFALLVVLLITGWTGKLRDWSYLGAHQRYFLAVFLYVLMFSVIAKVLSSPFDFIGFRLEHQYHLSNQRLRRWLWDECKGWLVGLVLGADHGGNRLRDYPDCAAALVDHSLGRLCRIVPAYGAACAGRADAHLL